MNYDELKARFPKSSESFLRANSSGHPLSIMTSKRKFWSARDLAALADYYARTPADQFSLPEIAKALNRTPAAVALVASKNGWTAPRGCRLKSLAHRKTMSEQRKVAYLDGSRVPPVPDWSTRPHPRGMLGKHHSAETRTILSAHNLGLVRPIESSIATLKTKFAKYGTLSPQTRRGSWRAGWREIGGFRKFYRSRWEANYARYLAFQQKHGIIKEWGHESEVFWFAGIKRGCVSYVPDFRVTLPDGSLEYHEVKGWMDAQSRTKIKRMRIYHPGVTLRVFDALWYRRNEKQLARLIPDWE